MSVPETPFLDPAKKGGDLNVNSLKKRVFRSLFGIQSSKVVLIDKNSTILVAIFHHYHYLCGCGRDCYFTVVLGDGKETTKVLL